MKRIDFVRSAVIGGAFAVLFAAGDASATASCQYEKFAEFDVNMVDGLPLVEVSINGKHGWFWFSNQSNATSIYKNAVDSLSLTTYPTAFTTSQNGVETFTPATHIDQFQLGGARAIPANLLVVSSPGQMGERIFGILSPTDYAGKTFDYDIPDRKIRILSERRCDGKTPSDWPASATPIKLQTRYSAQFDGKINGQTVFVQLDTAQPISTINQAAVDLAKLSVRPVSRPNHAGGSATGPEINGDRVARIDKLEFAGEVFHDVDIRLQAASTFGPTSGEPLGGFLYDDPRKPPPKITLGVDYLLTHRVLISIPQRLGYVAPTGGGLFGHIDQFEETVAFYAQAIAREPRNTAIYAGRANFYSGRGLHEQAIADYSKAIALEPNSSNYFYDRGLEYYYSGLFDQAVTDFTQSIELNPDRADAYHNRGSAYLRKGLYDLAIADYTHAITLKPDSADAFHDRGVAYQHQGNYEKAIADFTQLIRLRPDNAGAYNSRAWSYHLAGRDAEGLPDAEKAVALTPTNSAAIETRAEIFEKLGRRDAAIADYRAALRIKPDMASAQAGLKRLGVAP